MRVTVTCYGAMREYLPPDATGNSTPLDVGDGATVRDVVAALGAPQHLVFAVLVDDDQANLDRAVTEGATVTLMPPFTGGAFHSVWQHEEPTWRRP